MSLLDSHYENDISRQALQTGGDLWRDEEHSGRLGVRSTLRRLTHRRCLSAVSEANAASSPARPRNEHHSGVEAKRRPPQCEPPPGTAWREAAPKSQHKRNQDLESGTRQASATCRSLSRAKLRQKSQAMGSWSRSSRLTTTHLTPLMTVGTHQGE